MKFLKLAILSVLIMVMFGQIFLTSQITTKVHKNQKDSQTLTITNNTQTITDKVKVIFNRNENDKSYLQLQIELGKNLLQTDWLRTSDNFRASVTPDKDFIILQDQDYKIEMSIIDRVSNEISIRFLSINILILLIATTILIIYYRNFVLLVFFCIGILIHNNYLNKQNNFNLLKIDSTGSYFHVNETVPETFILASSYKNIRMNEEIEFDVLDSNLKSNFSGIIDRPKIEIKDEKIKVVIPDINLILQTKAKTGGWKLISQQSRFYKLTNNEVVITQMGFLRPPKEMSVFYLPRASESKNIKSYKVQLSSQIQSLKLMNHLVIILTLFTFVVNYFGRRPFGHGKN
jgi:hypothetical protein